MSVDSFPIIRILIIYLVKKNPEKTKNEEQSDGITDKDEIEKKNIYRPPYKIRNFTKIIKDILHPNKKR